MSVKRFIKKNISDLRREGVKVFGRKLKIAIKILLSLPGYVSALPFVLVIRLLRPFLLIRFGGLYSDRIGHFAANTEMHLCLLDAGLQKPEQPFIDIFYLAKKPVCNWQLVIMWKRVLRIWPAWMISPVVKLNRLLPGWGKHDIFLHSTALDVHNLLDRFPCHLQFTPEEERCGERLLQEMGIPIDAKFVCLIVRDSAYLDKHKQGQWDYHNYRDSDIQNYVLAAEELVSRGYFVVRMGVYVREPIKSTNPKVIDYATNGMRSDFMDIYLGEKCTFAISTGTGWDAIPEMFRRPIVYVNYQPLGYLHTFRSEFLSITKKHLSQELQRALTFQEIFTSGVGFSLHTAAYKAKAVTLIENTPEEIRDVAVEMDERLHGNWVESEDDVHLQKKFWDIFPVNAVDESGRPLHGVIRARIGAHFLRDNRDWL